MKRLLLLSLIFAVLAGYALSRFKFYGKGAAGFLLFATQMLPEALLVVPIYALFASLGLLNGMGGLILANVAFTMPTRSSLSGKKLTSPRLSRQAAASLHGVTVRSTTARPIISWH